MHTHTHIYTKIRLNIQWTPTCFGQLCGHNQGYKIKRLIALKVQKINVKKHKNLKYKKYIRNNATVWSYESYDNHIWCYFQFYITGRPNKLFKRCLFFFACVLFIVLCDLCFYVVLFVLLAMWLSTQRNYKHELNCNKLHYCQFLIV